LQDFISDRVAVGRYGGEMTCFKSIQLLCLGGLSLTGSLTLSARAQETADVSQIRAAAAAYIEALSQGEAAKIADFWTEDGIYIDRDGKSFPARTLASQEFANAESTPSEKKPASVPSTIHLVGSAVAIEQSSVDQSPDSAPTTPDAAQFIAVWAKQGDRWRLSLLREFPAPSVGDLAAPSSSLLGELNWMVGRWTAAQDDANVELTAEWTPDKSYLLQHFVATRNGEVIRRGTQRIALDPAAKGLRSWTFNADGSFSEGVWRKEGEVWVAESTGVLADGRRTTSVHFWTKEGDDGCWFKSLRGAVDGQPADELMLKFSRSALDGQ
jgi:ketosteroid isomerase-like protein